jgi:hypothetical protein
MARFKDPQSDRKKNLLDQLINTMDPDSGAGLTHSDVAPEAFDFLVAGSHTTSGTSTLLFYYLLHSHKAAVLLTQKLNDQLQLLDKGSNYNCQTLDPHSLTPMLVSRRTTASHPSSRCLPHVVTGKSPISSRKCFQINASESSSIPCMVDTTIKAASCHLRSSNKSFPININ